MYSANPQNNQLYKPDRTTRKGQTRVRCGYLP